MCYCQMITHCHKHLLFNSPKNRALECFLLFRYMRRIFALVLSRSAKDANKWRFIHFLLCLAKKRVASVLFMDFAICFCIVYTHIFFLLFSLHLFILFSFLLHKVCHSVKLSSVRFGWILLLSSSSFSSIE